MGYESGTTGVCVGVVKKPVPNNPLPSFDFPRQRPIFAADTRNIKEEQIMNATVSLEGILQMLRPLSADDKRWLASKLYEEVEEEEEHLTPYTMEELHARIERSLADAKAGRVHTTEEVRRMMESKYPCLCE